MSPGSFPSCSPSSPEAEMPDLLGPEDPPAVELHNPAGGAPLVIVCDHASNRIPHALGTLGLPPAALGEHIAWDIGAAAVARRLALALDAPAVLTGYSRLLVDANRPLDNPTLIPAVSGGIAIPANHGLDAAGRARRLAALYDPYHREVAARVAACRARPGCPAAGPALLSVHSFTPVMDGYRRPWQCGVLWNRDGRLAQPLLAALRADPAMTVGDNEPYSARTGPNQTLNAHAEDLGLPSVAIEIRQDLIAAEADAEAWAGRLAAVLRPILAGVLSC
jgi:predicted N-formylglutamate amidohydrolase